MDHRDRPIWFREARKRYAIDQKRMIEAVAFPNMDEAAQKAYMENLVIEANGTEVVVTESDENDSGITVTSTPEQEATWAKNRADLLDIVGRKA